MYGMWDRSTRCEFHAFTALVTATAVLRAFIEVWQNVFPEFIDSQLQTAARLALILVRSTSARIKAIFISGMSP